jgi:hypothetical protein
MRKAEVERYMWENINLPRAFWVFGEDLVDAGSPNPCSRSAAARHVLGGRWQKAYQMWLDEGEYSRNLEELYVGWILSSEVIVNKKPAPPIPDLPTRVWTYAEYNKGLRHFEDLKYRAKFIDGLLRLGKTAWCKERISIGALVQQNKWKEAEELYNQYEWRANDMAEYYLALIHSCVHAEPETLNQSAMWYYYQEGRGVGGPIFYEKLKGLFVQGFLTSKCMVCRKGIKEWTPATSFKCFESVIITDDYTPPPIPKKIVETFMC